MKPARTFRQARYGGDSIVTSSPAGPIREAWAALPGGATLIHDGRNPRSGPRAFEIPTIPLDLASEQGDTAPMTEPIPPGGRRSLAAVIFDVDGVIVASPHEQAWRAALGGITDPARLTTAIYQACVAGKPRMDGARAALASLGIADPGGLAERYADAKQQRIEALIAAGQFAAFPDALHFIAAVKRPGWRLALASSSKNAASMLRQIVMPSGQNLLALFDANLSGIDLQHGKPDPEIFLRAARAIGISPVNCLVVEDAPAGVAAGVAGGMATLGVARLDDAALLHHAGADLVVTSLADVDTGALAQGWLRTRPTGRT
jgi:beta-phosphoglucomutase